uniref:RNA cytidine acetyltransferase n=2 Tax=Leptocylindrus danicus TaxID=163516 RepID=A0A7S2PD83_9STRA
MTMDVHARYRTEGGGELVPRFNERFILSLGKCGNCLVCDDELNILPLSRASLKTLKQNSVNKGDAGEVIVRTSKEQEELDELKQSLEDTPNVGVLVELSKTLDQARAVLTFLEACSEKTNRSTIALTAARGRGKSAAIGLCLAGAISFGFSTIMVTAPEPENLVAVFDFVLRGLKALKYQEHLDFNVTYNNASGREQTKCITSIEVHREHHRQIIRYAKPQEKDKFATAEIVAIDEAAAIPLPVVRALMSSERLTFMSSTVNGYEGTGRALSLKLIKELRDAKKLNQTHAASQAASQIAGVRTKKGEFKVHEQRWKAAADAASGASSNSTGASLLEIELITPIRYATGDPVEKWLNNLLCLDCGSSMGDKLAGGAPAPSDCELYVVDRDALFSYHALSESFLQKMMGLYTSAHYKNSPNDLQMLSDAPAHAVFVLLSPSAEQDGNSLPDILCVIQVALEGKISRKAVEAQLARGHRSAGDLIPWTVSQQFGDSNFAQLSGARIVRVAVHPHVQGMGYGSRAVELLYRYYNGEMIALHGDGDESTEEESDDNDPNDNDSDNGGIDETAKGILGEKLKPRKRLPPLLLPLTEVKAPRLDWIGTSFGLTAQLYKFWKRAGMRMLYLRQTTNELTGEHSTIMVRALPRRTGFDDAWLPAFASDSQRRIVSLLGGPFQTMDVKSAGAILADFELYHNSQVNSSGNGNEAGERAIQARSGLSSTSDTISMEELNYFLTPHDLKRLEQYGRNLCDHHLVTDLLPATARLYFTGRFGVEFRLSNLQAALLCGIGLQNKTIDQLTVELDLPTNQVLAMFNKAVRKISMAFNEIAEESEKKNMLSDKARAKIEKDAEKLKNVTHQTLDEDAEEGAQVALKALKSSGDEEYINNIQDVVQDKSDQENNEVTNSAEIKTPGKRKLSGDDKEVSASSKKKSSKKDKSAKKKKSKR